MASGDGYRSPTAQSAADSFELRQDDAAPKLDSDNYRRPRPRGNSNAVRPNSNYQQPPLVDNAVNHAFERSDAAGQLDPTIVAQITQQVIDSLQANGIGQQQQPYFPPHVRSTRSRSPAESIASLTRPYTPPSPTRNTGSYGSSSPENPMFAADPYDNSHGFSRPDKSSSDTSPVRTEGIRSRPPQTRMPSTFEETVLEKAWQPLFVSGQPTLRLGQFLRGLALHIIEDYEPKRSLVIPPSKMVQFFNDVRLSSEIYPWRDIFGGRISCESISRIYRDLRCQHHFVQLGNHSTPDIPALTPDGFNQFMTVLIQAHPAMEYERLAKAVVDMPISNADNPKERFPKQLSRDIIGSPLEYAPNPYTRSEGTNIGDVPTAQYGSNMHADDRSRYSRREQESKRASWYPSRGYEYDGAAYDDQRRPPGGSGRYGSYNGRPADPNH
ncbi:hypothetical protein E4T47_06280 [Aureobasidium subglaciale]|nr:hypothetical protein E4T47_06280 [Aureobasidium subglaciale]